MGHQGADANGAGPRNLRGQGLDPEQEESGNAAILRLLTTSEGRAWTDFVATVRVDAGGGSRYEAWARRGMVAWVRERDGKGGFTYRVVEVIGENPIARQDPFALATFEEEAAAGGTADPMIAFVPHERLTYPYAYERISQLFDSADAPDLVVEAESFAFGRQPGQHGNLDVIQSRSPLIFSGPGVRRGVRLATEARQVDVAPTIAALMGFPKIDGRHADGRRCSELGHPPCRYLGWQDGEVIEAVSDEGSDRRPERAYILLLDGQSHTELCWRLENEEGAIPNLRRLIAGGAMLAYGSITNFPSITWPSHNAIGTSAWCGHHGIVNPSYYLRERREVVSPQGQQFDTARFLSGEVETLFEAFHRVYGAWDGADGGALTASIIEPCTRGADHASLERRLVGDRQRLIELTHETQHEINPRWKEELEDFGHRMMGEIDNRGLAQARLLLLDESHAPPKFVFHEFSAPDSAAHDYGPHHEGAREALDETDRRIGHILRTLDERGLLESTLFVITTDHGMAIQDVSLAANPARIPERSGMAAVTTEPFIYLRDMAVAVEVAHDGRSGRAWVVDNDADTGGENPPVAGARIVVMDHRDGVVARATTDAEGVAGFALPPDIRPTELRMSVAAEGFNTRHLRLDGTSLALDLREALYGRT